MEEVDPLDIRYEDHGGVRELVDGIRYCLEEISLGFDRWGEPHVQGPGLYLAVVAGRSVRPYADPMGDNRWPTGDCRRVRGDLAAFCEAAAEVARTRDGAVVVSVDGVIQTQMVRFRDLERDRAPERRPDRGVDAGTATATATPTAGESESGDGGGCGEAAGTDTDAERGISGGGAAESGRGTDAQAGDGIGPEAEPGTGTGYADWMGSRHMSALDTSRRAEVVTTLTLSAENGRVTAFRGGAYRSFPRTHLAARWRGEGEEEE